MQYWNVINARSPRSGIRLRDETRRPIESLGDIKFKFLEDFASYLAKWEAFAGPGKKNGGLSKATTTALQQSTVALVSVARYCLEHLGFDYVLLGKFSSDPIESMFGWCRQMNGGNYYVTCLQLFQNIKKIRAISLIRFANCTLEEFPESVTLPPHSAATVDAMTKSVAQLLLEALDPNAADVNVLNYVTGALIRRTLRQFKDCQRCQSALLCISNGVPDQMPVMSVDGEQISTSVASFVEMINRGGLLMPSPFAFAIGIKCWMVFDVIKENAELRCAFLESGNQKDLFVSIILLLLDGDCDIEELAHNQTCEMGHEYVLDLIGRLFGSFAKLFVRTLSTKSSVSAAATKRKIAKLCSSRL